ncbi:Hypothetical predicted protein [Lecanosticta acicola]|uniref:Uncharacterized protein n=1 Tax=Lecanosticta acicola TaxID=111012 RepID=A0AAI9EDT0_9PEZI|nr:Hypothetical predicted protein [Lecanosticta acicola]
MAPTLKSLTGKYHQSKSTSDVSPVLQLQGFNKILAATVSKAPINIDVTQKSDNEVQIKQTTTASIPAITEEWVHDWEWREFEDSFLGKVKSRSRWRKAGEVDDEFLKKGIEDNEEIVEAEVESLEKGWNARQVWTVEGSGEFVRRVVTSKGSERVETRLVYEEQR